MNDGQWPFTLKLASFDPPRTHQATALMCPATPCIPARTSGEALSPLPCLGLGPFPTRSRPPPTAMQPPAARASPGRGRAAFGSRTRPGPWAMDAAAHASTSSCNSVVNRAIAPLRKWMIGHLFLDSSGALAEHSYTMRATATLVGRTLRILRM